MLTNELRMNHVDLRGAYKSTTNNPDFTTHVNFLCRIIQDLCRPATDSQRSATLMQALELVDHDIETLHDAEVQQGIITVLCQQASDLMSKQRLNEEAYHNISVIFHSMSLA